MKKQFVIVALTVALSAGLIACGNTAENQTDGSSDVSSEQSSDVNSEQPSDESSDQLSEEATTDIFAEGKHDTSEKENTYEEAFDIAVKVGKGATDTIDGKYEGNDST